MPAAAEGVVAIDYRPLATMDELQLLLLVAVAAGPGNEPQLAGIFSLPESVIAEELGRLAAYGLATKHRRSWRPTDRGERVTAVWNALACSSTHEIVTDDRQWRLGPGEFTVEEIVRDRAEIDAYAKDFAIPGADAAAEFLAERRRRAAKFESFVAQWPVSAAAAEERGEFAHTTLFENLKSAESEEALATAERLLATHVDKVVSGVERLRTRGGTDGREDPAGARRRGKELSEAFKRERRAQHRTNRRTAQTTMICEAILARRWLVKAYPSLTEAFDAEPAAFVLKSTVPLAAARTEKPQGEPRSRPRAAATPPQQEEEGMLSSLFRWWFG